VTTNELMAKLLEQAQQILDQEVARKAVEIQKQNIDREVYGAYKPYLYKRRRMKSGGLRWGATWRKTGGSKTSAEISIYNKGIANTSGAGYTFKNLPYLIEYGHKSSGYIYDFTYNRRNTAYKYKNPRPFMKRTYEEIKRTNMVKNTLAEGLRGLGYKVNIR
jgi:hypothetical protein